MAVTNTTLTQQALEAIGALSPNILPLRAFSTDFSDAQLLKGDSRRVRLVTDTGVATEFNVSSNNYSTIDAGDNDDGVSVTLSSQPKSTFAATNDEIERGAFSLRLAAHINRVAKKVVTDALALVTNANYGAAAFTGAASAFDSDDLIDIKTTIDGANWGDRRIAVLATAHYNALLKEAALKSVAAMGTTEALWNGVLPKLAGFDLIESNILPGNSENLVGFVTDGAGILVATALPKFQQLKGTDQLYLEPIVEPTSGLTLLLGMHIDTATRKQMITVECLAGSLKGRAAGLKRLVSA